MGSTRPLRLVLEVQYPTFLSASERRGNTSKRSRPLCELLRIAMNNNPSGSGSGDSSAARTAFSASLTVRTLRHAAFISPRGSA